jgi:N-methylhydantoinase A
MEAAWGIRKVLDSKMADLLRRMTVERGHNPQEFTLFANGGAGPSHAWVLSAELGLNGFVVPAAATAQSAYGTANADLGFSTERPSYVRIAPGDTPTAAQLEGVNQGISQAIEETKRNLSLAAPGHEITLELTAAIRFRGQTNYLDVPLRTARLDPESFSALTAQFESAYETLFGRGSSYSSAGFELLSVRVTGTCSLPLPARGSRGDPITQIGSRKVVFDDPAVALDTVIYRTVFPDPGAEASGPCIIEFPGQSVVVPPGATANADAFGNLIVGTI